MSQLKNGTLLHGGTYKIEKVLGQGSFGITYLAEHTTLGKKVAIKEFFMKELNSRGDDGSITGLSDGSLSYNYAQKFRKEAQNLARMEHPNIVRVTDSFDGNGTFYYVMEYIDGMNLNDYIKRYTPSEKTAVEIIKEVAVALQYMHEEKHMLHLDLKPGNIMRRKGDGHIFLIDFGLSKHYDTSGAPETSTTIGLGTAGYAPIEQANQAKNGEFRPTIDVYALGATLYKLLTRDTPPAASELVTDDELISDKLKECGISNEIAAVVVNAMLPNVRKRTQTIKEFVVSLQSTSTKQPSVTKEDVAVDNEGTLIVGGNASVIEETEVIKPKERTTHPDFKESSYKIDGEYIKFPTVTKHKADGGDEEAILALGMMTLRGEGMRQDFDAAHEWFSKLKNLGDDRGEKLIAQWDTIKETYCNYQDEQTQESEHNGMQAAHMKMLFLIIASVVAIISLLVYIRGAANPAQDQISPKVTYQNNVLQVGDVQYKMIPVEGGTFTMGKGKDIEDDAKPAHKVTLSSYYIGETEVTQALWKAVMLDNPSHIEGDNLPVARVDWEMCQQFILILDSVTGKNFRLPTEAEWEFAARGGNKSKHYQYSGSNNLDDVAWYPDNSEHKLHVVATKQPNELGIYDMSGNVFEWCQDWYGNYSSSAQTNPTGPNSGSKRVCRGGNCDYADMYCRTSFRCSFDPNWPYGLGLRLVLSE